MVAFDERHRELCMLEVHRSELSARGESLSARRLHTTPEDDILGRMLNVFGAPPGQG